MKLVTLIFITLCFSVSLINAQNENIPPKLLKAGAIPTSLHPSLKKRLDEFIEIQRGTDLTKTFGFLAGEQSTSSSKFTNEQKRCVIEQIEDSTIIDFKPTKITFSTANFSRPLNKKIWIIHGEAEFRTNTGNFKKNITISARYLNQNWFFSLPDYYRDEWYRKKLAQADVSTEMKQYLEIVEETDRPLEFFDISVKIDPSFYSLRKYSFQLKNKTRKTIKRFGYKIAGSGTVMSSTTIKPDQSISSYGSYGAFQPFCSEIEYPVKLFIHYVDFNDGTKWKSKFKF